MIKNIKNIKNFRFTFSPKALLSVVPTVVLFRIQKFLVSLGSLVDFGSRSCITTFEKQENYINFKNFIHIKLNCLTVLECETPKTYYLFFKELLYYIIFIYFRFSREIPLIILRNYENIFNFKELIV